MMYNVGVEIGKNVEGKGIYWFRRVHASLLNEFIRKAQDNGGYIFSVTKLYPIRKIDDTLREERGYLDTEIEDSENKDPVKARYDEEFGE